MGWGGGSPVPPRGIVFRSAHAEIARACDHVVVAGRWRCPRHQSWDMEMGNIRRIGSYLMIISGILLFLALAITLTGCNDGEPEPTVTPTPTATAGPTISSTSSATTSSPQEIFEPFPTPDVQPLGPTISGPDPYRVVFLLDNSITPMTKCPEAPEMPDNSRARRLMKETTTFLVNLLAAVNGPTNPGVQIGVYTLYGWNKNDGLGSMTLTPLQPADNYEWDRDGQTHLNKC